MRTFLFFVGSAVGSVAFQVSVALYPQTLQHYAWAVRYVWIAWGGIWLLWLLARLLQKPSDSLPPGAVQTANPVQTVNQTVVVNPAPAPPPILPRPVAQPPIPNVRLLEPEVTKIRIREHGQRVMFLERNDNRGDDEVDALLAHFRNDAVFGREIAPVRYAGVHLKFFDADNNEIGHGVSGVVWLNNNHDAFDLVAGGQTGSAILLVSLRDRLVVPWKRDIHTEYGQGKQDEGLELPNLPASIEVSLLNSRNQLVLPPERLELNGSNGTLRAMRRFSF